MWEDSAKDTFHFIIFVVVPWLVIGSVIWLVIYFLRKSWRTNRPQPVEVQPYVAPEPVAPKYPPMPRMGYNENTYYGSANWDNPADINDFYNKGIENDLDTGGGYFIGEKHAITPLVNGITIAGSGQGKGVSLILNNLLRQPTCSWFVLDPKGENAFVSAGWQQKAGQKVVLLDPWNEQERLGATHGIKPLSFNPLLFAKSNPDELAESCGVIAEMLVPDKPESKDSYWDSRARALIQTYLLHLLTDRPEEEQHLGTLYRWLRYSTNDRRRLWFHMDENEKCDELVKSGINEFMGLSEDSGPLPSILSNASDATKFLESQALRAALEKNEFDPYELNNGKTTLYLILPERYLSTHARWLRLVVGVCLKACNYNPQKRVNFLLDEFAIMGKMPDVQRAYAFGRGQNISVWAFVQTFAQLVEIYGELGANSFMANSRLRQFFGVYDLYTQRYLSETLGDTTIKMMIHSQSETKGESTGTSTGWSTSSTIAGTSSSSSDSKSSSTSTGTTSSSSSSISSQFIGRRLLSNEEIGKVGGIITLIDGKKFLLGRLAFWDSYYDAFLEKRTSYFPRSESEWHDFCDKLAHEKPRDKDLVTVFQPRAAGKMVKIEN